jgi:cytochrome oxidase assembly protein ShyY1
VIVDRLGGYTQGVGRWIVLAAIAVMVRLGFWQLERLHEKEALIARAEAALTMNAEAPWPRSAAEARHVLYRHARVNCTRVIEEGAGAGENARAEPGWAHFARCALAGGGEAKVILGWSRDPGRTGWRGGEVGGVIAPGPRLVAGPAIGGLQDNAQPNPADLPNNHLSYAVQWFLFAAVALVIYGLAVRKRLAEPGPRR